ncbi:hypothetical protein CAOG_09047 [Capsaspora owczarzaki ATCC 30864]|uniref:hypothetical protein n=1 Tax=Capsaspora owczarzaki (strain ATCC 30864) TaxID=595528 RepID=UPI0003521E69|nr:hypothetical protein CAOG_09047 [Capsaspora owczarzaki ATCC 30864]|eukprot:XP_011270735.1 hypothetical protein CAOG_09047 [Capsaspora owczarzaki ATCC 30864]
MRTPTGTGTPKQIERRERRQAVLDLLRQGATHPEIAAQSGLSLRSIRRIIQQCPTGVAREDAPRSGRPKLLDDRDRRRLARLVSSTPGITSGAAAAALTLKDGRHPSSSTVQNELHAMKYVNALRVTKLKLTRKDRQKRLKFCRDHASWTVAQWRTVIFSDEAFIKIHSSSHRGRVWRKRGERLAPGMVKETLQQGGSRIHIWSAVSRRGCFPLIPIEGNLGAHQYAKLLDTHFWKGLDKLGIGSNFIYQQDNAPARTSKVVEEWLELHQVNVLPWPPYSPDLNPIENMWSFIQRGVLAQYHPSNQAELWRDMQKWSEEHVTPAYCRKLIDSMPTRIQACIKAKGGHIDY